MKVVHFQSFVEHAKSNLVSGFTWFNSIGFGSKQYIINLVDSYPHILNYASFGEVYTSLPKVEPLAW